VRNTNYYDNSTNKYRMGEVHGMYKSNRQTVVLNGKSGIKKTAWNKQMQKKKR